MKPIVILGSGGQAQELAWMIEDNNISDQEWDILGFVSKKDSNAHLKYPILGDDEWLLNRKEKTYLVCAIGDTGLRERVVSQFTERENIVFPTIISRHAVVSDTVRLGRGTMVCAGCVITTDVEIGDFVICNPGCIVSHETKIGNYVTMNAGVRISGNVSIGAHSYIGVNACTLQGINIGRDVVVGAGAAVINDLPDKSIAVGVPAKVIKLDGRKVVES